MSSLVAVVAAIVLGAVVAAAGSVATVSVASSRKPDVVQQDLIRYGTR